MRKLVYNGARIGALALGLLSGLLALETFRIAIKPTGDEDLLLHLIRALFLLPGVAAFTLLSWHYLAWSRGVKKANVPAQIRQEQSLGEILLGIFTGLFSFTLFFSLIGALFSGEISLETDSVSGPVVNIYSPINLEYWLILVLLLTLALSCALLSYHHLVRR